MKVEVSERTHTELIELQKLVSVDIAFFKTQQWRTANYGMLLYAAIAAFPKVMPARLSSIEYLVLWGAAIAVLVAGIYILKELESALLKRRDLIAKLRLSFTSQALEIYGLGDPDEAMRPGMEKVSLKYVFTGAFSLGFALTSWALFKWSSYAPLA